MFFKHLFSLVCVCVCVCMHAHVCTLACLGSRVKERGQREGEVSLFPAIEFMGSGLASNTFTSWAILPAPRCTHHL